MKSKVTMFDWELYVYNGTYSLKGVADNHPRLGKNATIGSTSDLVKYAVEDDVLLYETQNTIYLCPFKYMRSKFLYANVIGSYKKALADLYKNATSDLDEIISAAAQIAIDDKVTDLAHHIAELQPIGQAEIRHNKEEFNNHLLDEVSKYDNSIYFEVSSISGGSPISYNVDGKSGIIEPAVHVGTFQDSVLYMDNSGVLDFRYFPKGCVIETYGWSDNIKQVIVKNTKGYTIYFNGVTIDPQEIKTIQRGTRSYGMVLADCSSEGSLVQDGIE